MAYLYDEIAPERKHKLLAHLSRCADCGQQLDRWRCGMAALDGWQLPAMRGGSRQWQPGTILKWAVAVVVVLGVGFALGRQTSSAANEVAALKVSVSQLAERVERERALEATAAAVVSEGLVLMLSDYAKLDDERHAEERRTVALGLRDIDSRH